MIAIQTDDATAHPQVGNYDSEAGVAVAGPAELGGFTSVPTADSQRLLLALHQQLNRAESEAIAERIELDWQGRAYTFPATAAERAARPFAYTDFVRAERTESGRTFYYFTGSKTYGPNPYPHCEASVAFAAVIIRERDGRVASPLVRAGTTFDCSSDSSLEMVPLATVHWSGPVLWVIRSDAEDGFDYSLVNPAAATDSEEVQLKGLWGLRVQPQ